MNKNNTELTKGTIVVLKKEGKIQFTIERSLWRDNDWMYYITSVMFGDTVGPYKHDELLTLSIEESKEELIPTNTKVIVMENKFEKKGIIVGHKTVNNKNEYIVKFDNYAIEHFIKQSEIIIDETINEDRIDFDVLRLFVETLPGTSTGNVLMDTMLQTLKKFVEKIKVSSSFAHKAHCELAGKTKK
jgi:hypothetical protein